MMFLAHVTAYLHYNATGVLAANVYVEEAFRFRHFAQATNDSRKL